jgi:hypothetical protein
MLHDTLDVHLHGALHLLRGLELVDPARHTVVPDQGVSTDGDVSLLRPVPGGVGQPVHEIALATLQGPPLHAVFSHDHAVLALNRLGVVRIEVVEQGPSDGPTDQQAARLGRPVPGW